MNEVKELTFYSIKDLAFALREAEQAHKKAEEAQAELTPWPEFYAAFLFEHEGSVPLEPAAKLAKTQFTSQIW